MVLRIAEMEDATTEYELGELAKGKSVDKELHIELAYAELDKTIDNIWSILFMMGYLTHCGRNEDGTRQRELASIFREECMERMRLFLRRCGLFSILRILSSLPTFSVMDDT